MKNIISLSAFSVHYILWFFSCFFRCTRHFNRNIQAEEHKKSCRFLSQQDSLLIIRRTSGWVLSGFGHIPQNHSNPDGTSHSFCRKHRSFLCSASLLLFETAGWSDRAPLLSDPAPEEASDPWSLHDFHRFRRSGPDCSSGSVRRSYPVRRPAAHSHPDGFSARRSYLSYFWKNHRCSPPPETKEYRADDEPGDTFLSQA